MKIKHRLILTYGLLVILAFAIVGINFITFNTIESDSNFINYSGKLRAESFKMAQLSNVIINHSNSNLKKDLTESINRFDFLILSLKEGSTELNIIKLDHQPTQLKLRNIEELWYTKHRIAYNKIIEEDDMEALDMINNQVSEYVNTIDDMVTGYSINANNKVIRAELMNGVLSLIAMIVAIFSFFFMNNGIRKPIDDLVLSLKELSSTDGDLVRKIHLSNMDELTEMKSYIDQHIYDALTQVYSRGAGLAKLAKMIQNDGRYLRLSLCFIDINGLKQVNDVLGHEVGDSLIISSIEPIKESIRESDFIIRMGGDEFLIVLANTKKETAESIWARILNMYDSINSNENNPYIISVSHGIVEYYDHKGAKIESLVKAADEIMYTEKRKIKETLNANVIKKTVSE